MLICLDAARFGTWRTKGARREASALSIVDLETLDEAVALLAEFGDDALVMAGGLSLGALLNMHGAAGSGHRYQRAFRVGHH